MRSQSLALLTVLCLGVPPAFSWSSSGRGVELVAPRLPISFEANRGQADPDIKYLAHGPAYTLCLTNDSASLYLAHPVTSAGRLSELNVLRMKLAGANSGAKIVGTGELPGKSNYLVGNDPAKWVTNVPTYRAVRYIAIYPGIDLVYHADHRLFEYDFVVAPGANTHNIEIRMEGATNLKIDRTGNLVITVGDVEVIEPVPTAYQETPDGRRTVFARYVLLGSARVGFSVAHYDPKYTLIIDPTLVYSTYVGGQYQRSSTVDALGNVYITGGAYNNMPTTANAFERYGVGGNALVIKLTPDGSSLVYSTYVGGGAIAQGMAIAVDASGNAYITGTADSASFPTTPGAYQSRFLGGVNNPDGFVTKLNASGSGLIYSTFLGGTSADHPSGLAVDAWGCAYIAGSTSSVDFPVTQGAFQKTFGGGASDIFISKLDANGRSLVYSSYLGGSDQDFAPGIAVDALGYAYLTGSTLSPDFPKTPGALQSPWTTFGAFVSKMNIAGSALVYSAYLGHAQGFGIAIDAAGNAYVTGVADPTFDTTPGAFRARSSQWFNTFITKLNTVGTARIYSTFLGGSSSGAGDSGRAIAVDRAANAYVTGVTSSPLFPVTPDALQSRLTTSFAGTSDAFLTKLDAAGGRVLYSTYLGGLSGDMGLSVGLDQAGNAYVGGGTGPGFPTTSGAYQTQYFEGTGFVSKFSFGSVPVTTVTLNGPVGNNGWFRGPVTVRFNVSADSEIVWATYYKLDDGAYQQYVAPFSVTTDGAHQLLFYSVNANGREIPHGSAISIDHTPPVLSGMPISGCLIWPPNGQMVSVAVVAAVDALSGLVPGSFQVSGASNEPSGESAISILPTGNGQFIVRLQSDRLGTADGRIYTLTARASDLAGNTATLTATCMVPHDLGR